MRSERYISLMKRIDPPCFFSKYAAIYATFSSLNINRLSVSHEILFLTIC
ncbi:hypothetical protein G3P92_004951 [Escherichia coli]|nr:hypothetical protein [Escherichia coli]EFI3453351.1 hypothetical protein [Escherichia coli]EFI3550901.1 hypothetical protein [Escherichia coli]EFI3886203.1 hypothetical protein [Escherichia coli]EFI4243026.1 hypothetical protein [Escherichia coli]